MATKDLSSLIHLEQSIIPAAAKTADANGTGVDCQGFESVTIVFNIGNSGDTLSGTVYAELEVEESDDDSTYTDVADADLTATVTGNNTGTIAKIDAPTEDSRCFWASYTGSKRYVRPVYNVTGTHTNGTIISACVLLGHPHSAPTTYPIGT